MKQIFGDKSPEGWTYYVNWGIAWIPMYCQGTLIWLRRYWVTWPETKDGKLIYAADVMPDWFDSHGKDYNPEMYRTYYPYDPRKVPTDGRG